MGAQHPLQSVHLGRILDSTPSDPKGTTCPPPGNALQCSPRFQELPFCWMDL